MTFFAAARRGRREDAELGQGVWRRAHDRFIRGLDRYHQILEGIQDAALYEQTVPVANELSDLLPRVRAVCVRAHALAPSAGMDIPASRAGYLSEVHRALSSSGNALAATAEALAMAKLDGGRAGAPLPPTSSVPPRLAQSVERRAVLVVRAVSAAEQALRRGAGSPDGRPQ